MSLLGHFECVIVLSFQLLPALVLIITFVGFIPMVKWPFPTCRSHQLFSACSKSAVCRIRSIAALKLHCLKSRTDRHLCLEAPIASPLDNHLRPHFLILRRCSFEIDTSTQSNGRSSPWRIHSTYRNRATSSSLSPSCTILNLSLPAISQTGSRECCKLVTMLQRESLCLSQYCPLICFCV